MTLREYYNRFGKAMDSHIIHALAEDRVNNDVTTRLLFNSKLLQHKTKAKLVCKEDCVLAGKDVFVKVFKFLKPGLKVISGFRDGDFIKKGTVVLSLEAPNSVLLAGERTALNYIQRMSGVATLTRQFVNMLKYPGSKVIHTRKTTPGFRLFEIAAVKIGGGDFHRMDLSSAVMIKDNHIEAEKGIKNVVRVLNSKKLTVKLQSRFEIEVKNISELKYVVRNHNGLIKIIMLDNFNRPGIIKALKILRKSGIKTELSGGINLRNFGKVQFPGLDFYSIGALTHGYKSVDYSLEF